MEPPVTYLKRLPQIDMILVGINGCMTPEQRSQVGRLQAASGSKKSVCVFNLLLSCKNWQIIFVVAIV